MSVRFNKTIICHVEPFNFYLNNIIYLIRAETIFNLYRFLEVQVYSPLKACGSDILIAK